jgi:hypothetical protein
MAYITPRPAGNNHDLSGGCDSDARHNPRASFFRGAYYILAGGIAGIVVGGVISPIFGLNGTEAYGLLSAVAGALSVVVMRAFRII